MKAAELREMDVEVLRLAHSLEGSFKWATRSIAASARLAICSSERSRPKGVHKSPPWLVTLGAMLARSSS